MTGRRVGDADVRNECDLGREEDVEMKFGGGCMIMEAAACSPCTVHGLWRFVERDGGTVERLRTFVTGVVTGRLFNTLQIWRSDAQREGVPEITPKRPGDVRPQWRKVVLAYCRPYRLLRKWRLTGRGGFFALWGWGFEASRRSPALRQASRNASRVDYLPVPGGARGRVAQ